MDGTATRIESFPFDSAWEGYDDEGYPVYDRAVGSVYLRAVLRQFFTTGIFGTPSDTFLIKDAGDGLNIEIMPGLGIIDGAIGGILGDLPLTLELTSGPTKGKAAYGVFLRLDDNDEFRSLYIRIAKGETSSNPTPPPIDTSDAAVSELRLGYVIVPSNALDLTEAEFFDERGTSVCPYAAPFDTIDVSDIIYHIKQDSKRVYNQYKEHTDLTYGEFAAYIERYRDVIDAALGEEAAAELMRQISALGLEPLGNEQFRSYMRREAQYAGTQVTSAANLHSLTADDLMLMATDGARPKLPIANGPFIAITEDEYEALDEEEKADGTYIYALYNA